LAEEETFMKLYRNWIILGVVLALLIGAYVFMSQQKAKPSDDPGFDESDLITVQELESEKVKELTIENKNGKFVFGRETVKENDQEKKVWVYAENRSMKFENSQVDNIASDMVYVSALKVIEEKAADLSKYGLNKPSSISLKMEDGSVKSLEFGDKTPTGDAYYMKQKENNKVYTVSTYKADPTVEFSMGSIMIKTVFPETLEEIIGLTLEKDGNIVFSSKKVADSEWDLTAPLTMKASYDKIGPILEALVKGTKGEFIESNAADLSKYGLDKPSYAVELVTATSKVKVLLGKEKTRNQDLYAKLADSSEVFTMSQTAFNFVDKPLREIAEPFVFIPNIKDTTRIVVDFAGKKTTSEIATDPEGKDNEKDKFTVNGKDATMKDSGGKQIFRGYYQAVVGVTLSDFEIGAVPSGTPEVTFTYYLKTDPGTMKVEFIPKDANYYYVVKNGVYNNMVVAKSKFEEPEALKEMTDKLLKAIEEKK
jgi:hypothetical protein